MTRRTRGVVAAMAVAILGAAAPAAHAAVSFSDPSTLGTYATFAAIPATVSDVAVGGDGSVGVLANAFTMPPAVTIRDADGTLSAPLPIGAALGFGSDLALDDSGNALVVSNEIGGVMWRFRPRGGAWSAPLPLNPAADAAALPSTIGTPKVVFLSDGSALAVYATADNRLVSLRRPRGGTFPAAVTQVAAAGEAANNVFDLVAGPGGRALASWTKSPNLLRARPFQSSSWGAVQTVATASGAAPPNPRYGFRQDGTVDAAWVEMIIGAPDPITMVPSITQSLRAASRGTAATSTWSAATLLDSATSPESLIGGDVGEGAIAWTKIAGTTGTIRTARAVAGGFSVAGSPLATLSTPFFFVDPSVEPLADGRRLVVWPDGMTMNYVVVRSDGSEEARGTIPTATGAVKVVTDAAHRTGAVVWSQSDIALTTSTVRAMLVRDPAATQPPAAPTEQPQPPVERSASQARTPVDTVAPAVSALRLSRSKFRVGSRPTALGAAAKKKRTKTATGTELRWTSSEGGRVRIDVERLTRGYRSGSRCVAKRPKKAKGRVRRCDRVSTSGTLIRKLAAGANTLKFSGRVGSRALPTGRYRFALIAVDAAGNASAVKRVAFTVVAR